MLAPAIQPCEIDETAVTPPVPESIEESGIPVTVVEHLVLKYLHFNGELSGREIAAKIGLQFSVISSVLDRFKHRQIICVKNALGYGPISSVFALTESGRNLVRQYLGYNQYVGPAPVPLYQYATIVEQQKRKPNWLCPEQIQQAYEHLVVEKEILAQLGPAVSACESFLIYGHPGNGKTALAEALVRIQSAPIFIPYALEHQGNIIQLYDPIYHSMIEEEQSVLKPLADDVTYDARWFKSPRPFIVTGGELAMDMLDLSYNVNSKVYDAPFQLKANNGIYLIDDFGRQKATPKEILNRWIVAMERRVYYLNLHSGGKVTVPFETFLIFSTNLQPNDLGDEAFLRRIQYKMFVPSPKPHEFIHIFKRICEASRLKCPAGLPESFVRKHYLENAKPFRRCHPRDIINHAVHILNFERSSKELCEDLLDRAFYSCFAQALDES